MGCREGHVDIVSKNRQKIQFSYLYIYDTVKVYFISEVRYVYCLVVEYETEYRGTV